MKNPINTPPQHEIICSEPNGVSDTTRRPPTRPFSLKETRPGSSEYVWNESNEQGSAYYTMTEISPGFELWFHRSLFKEDIMMSFQNKDIDPLFVFSFCFSGDVMCQGKLSQMPISLIPQSQQLFYFPWSDPDATIHVAKDVIFSRLIVSISHTQFLDCFDKDMDALAPPLRSIVESSGSDLFSHTEPVVPMANILLNQLQHCPFQGETRSRFFEGCALNMMALQLNALENQCNFQEKYRTMHPDEQKRVRQIKELLDSRLENPPSLTELAREAAMSPPRLNKCFRTLYGTTVFEYLSQKRFNRARSMLEQGLSVTEASLAMGYESLSSFSSSFKKRFGYPPSRYFSQK